MIKIKDIMNYIYENLSQFAPVYYEDMERQEDGSIELKSTNIVYNLEGMYKTTDDRVRKDIPLIIDVWYLKKDLYDIEDMVHEIDKGLSNVSVMVNDKAFKVSRETNYYMNIPDDSLNIRRKRLKYLIKYFNH